jgi:AraC family transcriptional regulator of adaptative response / DNA-3-methyladenine glycosylase II
MRLILDGAVDRVGVSGLAAAVGYSERQLNRMLGAEVGTGALSIARAQRAQTARLLLETTDLPVTTIAFAAGFASVRQFNDTVKSVFARTPTALRTRRSRDDRARTPTAVSGAGGGNGICLRLAYRAPLAAAAVMGFLGQRAVPGIEATVGDGLVRSLRLDHGDGVVELQPDDGFVRATFHLEDLRDLTSAVRRCRRLLDLDADPHAVAESFAGDPVLAPLVRCTPGLRMPGAPEGTELAVRAVVGQQVSVAGARTVLGRLVRHVGRPNAVARGAVTHVFPSPAEVAEAVGAAPVGPHPTPTGDDDGRGAFAMPLARRRTLGALAGAVASGDLDLGPGADPAAAVARMLSLNGIGPWTAGYIAMRGLGDPDVFMATDLGIRRAAARLGLSDDTADLGDLADRWRPWRSYAMAYLWASLGDGSVPTTDGPTRTPAPAPAPSPSRRRSRPPSTTRGAAA